MQCPLPVLAFHRMLVLGALDHPAGKFRFEGEMTMTINMGSFDRILRVIGGIILLVWAIMGTSEWHLLGWIGVVPLATAATGWCPLYTILGVSSLPASKN